MKRTLALLSVAALVATPAVAEAAKKPAKKVPTKRVVTWSYSGTAGPSIAGTGFRLCSPSGLVTCFDLSTEKWEKNVKVQVKDASGQKVAVQYDVDGNYSSGATNICAAGDAPVGGGSVLTFNPTFDPTCGAPATSGTVTFTITGLK